jgi:hypothetical protein
MISIENYSDDYIIVYNSYEEGDFLLLHKDEIFTLMRMLADIAKSLNLEEQKEKTWLDA